MENKESLQLSSREELIAAINETASDKITDLTEKFGEEPELKGILQVAIDRIRTEQVNFYNMEINKIHRFGNTLLDVFEIFNGRIDLHCLDLYNAADRIEAEEPRSGVHNVKKIQHEVKTKTKKVA